ncbi:methylated-DNA--[protein]-cysteine S-methyltransferase [Clostridium sp. MD294]|uniref:methylated-DNA--[protein]-cysteine S-methyltransferase n=1 Tax=Clostridium sp. MD294 TaxID=97138 RepID=UPI0005549E7B|nr:methylated-DNA--[protein]-cysteine S-methyltransferase [Clostridium sp. MD294]NDO47355.1 methylated-DNA--[protein]-cysteine S-methyltransferase [Clostridium sp. MD294]
MKYRYEIKTPLGIITLVEMSHKISHIYYGIKKDFLKIMIQKTPLLELTEIQILEYFEGTRKSFSLPLLLEGTIFQKKVWQALQTIPYGETKSYGQIAKEIGCDKAVRAVGGANHNNPIAIVVPCHRVIGANGKLTGYNGGLEKKEFLLKLEKAL